MQESPVITHAPSFNIYSNGKVAEIAARVVEEFDSDEEFYVERRENSAAERAEEGRISDNRVRKLDADDEENEFEFAVVRNSELSSLISADEIFQNGKIRPVYPVFDRDLLLGHVKFENENGKENGVRNSISSKGTKIRLPLRKLFIEERETTMTMSSSSSSEAEELDGVPAEMYCVWRTKEAEAEDEEEGRCRKSGSAGCYSKRWKLKDLLNRSNSDGSTDSFVFLPRSNSGSKIENNEKKVKETPVGGGEVKSAPPPSPCNRDGGEKRRSCLPYRQDLVGGFR